MDSFNHHFAAATLTAGQAIKLRAKALRVLRITHGRVWVTLTDVGPYSRVMDGDHFLSPGDSLTLLPGQELVMEPFGKFEAASAQFSWDSPSPVAAGLPAAARPDWRGGVGQPLLDLRYASGLAVRAVGLLVLGLGQAAAAKVQRAKSYLALISLAYNAGKYRAESTSNTACKNSESSCRLH